MKLTITFEELDLLTASLGSFVDDDDVDEGEHEVASAMLERLLVATDAAKNTPLDQPFPPMSLQTIAEIEIMLESTSRWAKWESGWNQQVRSELAERDAELCSSVIRRLRAALDEVLAARSIVVTVLPDRGE